MKKNNTLPTSSRMVLRALDATDPCIIAIDASDFWALPTSLHKTRPSVLTFHPQEFFTLVEKETGKTVSDTLARGDANRNLQETARKIFQDHDLMKGGAP